MPAPIKAPPSIALPPTAPLQSAQARSGKRDAGKLKEACQDFEALMVQYMMRQMRQTVPKDGLFSGGQAESMYADMLDGEVAKSVSRQRGMGLAAILLQQLSGSMVSGAKK